MNILVLDVGTSSMRGTLLDDSVNTIWRKQLRYSPSFGTDGSVEQSPSDWLGAAEAICASAAGKYAVGALAITAQRSSIIPVSDKGVPLRDAIMWQDTRNETVCEARRLRNERVRELSGSDINTVYSGGKMVWLRENEPVIYRRAHKLVTVPEYLIYHMTGCFATDETYGSRSLLMDIRTRRWLPELLELFGVAEEKLCRLGAPSRIAGGVTPAFAGKTGLLRDTPVITCGGDQQCALLGQGVIGPGGAAVNLGTGAYLLAAAETVPDTVPKGLVCNASAVPGQYMLEASVLTCGAAVDWFLAGDNPSSIGNALRESPPGAKGVTALPYFQGRSAPTWDSSARAAFLGLSLETTRADMLRALLEALLIETGRSLRAMEDLQPVEKICLSGGLSRAPEVRQLLTDVTGKPVCVYGDDEATTRGAWMSAACCMGLSADWTEAWKSAKPEDVCEYVPATGLREFYNEKAAHAEALYQAIRGV